VPPAASPAPSDAASDAAAVGTLLDDWHQAAAKADEARYFRHMAPGAVFLGTDAKERWTLDEFRAYAHPHFASGKGWTFVPRVRHVSLSNDYSTAWFDEILDSAPYGTCRGTGVLRKFNGTWRIEQYALTIPVPNDLADQLVALIRAQQSTKAAPAQPASP
jgi:ketosteroid isomerase-like protein